MRRRGRHPTGVSPGGAGRFDGFDVLSQVTSWDPVTARVVLRRLGPPAPLRFFSVEEEAIAGPLLDHLLDQWTEPQVPVLRMVDERLTEASTDGWHYADLPPDGPAWRRTLAALDDDARAAHGSGFAACGRSAQAALIQAVQDRIDAGSDWHGRPAKQVWSLWTRYACTAFYSHPWAWNEIGFGGPAYPRGYKHMGLDGREPWETGERAASDPIPTVAGLEAVRRRDGSQESGQQPGAASVAGDRPDSSQ